MAMLAIACADAPEPAPPAVEAPWEPDAPAAFVGSAECATCHADAAAAYASSDHDRALEAPSDTTIEGDFDGAPFGHHGTTTTASRDDAGWSIEADAMDGTAQRFEVRHTLGVRPLQQVLVAGEGGRLHAPHTAWDTREGGGWFHLYPDEDVGPGSPMHWQAPLFTANHMCISCHVTGFSKGYDRENDQYDSRWAEDGVGCEACHGPGSQHVAWAARSEAERSEDPWLPVRYPSRAPWQLDASTGIAAPHSAVSSELQTCARCHSRRSPLVEGPAGADSLLDTHRLTRLEPGLYYDDGQIHDEVYVVGSFMQSPMYAAGVGCSDCHDPHSGQTRAPGAEVCSTCHDPSVFDTETHHHHGVGQADCLDCHMPAKLYMGVDARRDHSFRVPRPDLAVDLGVPEPCTTCHTERDAAWALGAVSRWYPEGRHTQAHYGHTLARGADGAPGAAAELLSLATDTSYPTIVRASALDRLSGAAVPPSALRPFLHDDSGLVRLALAELLESVPPDARFELGRGLLGDPLRAVRVAAALSLFDATSAQGQALSDAHAELLASLELSADRPGALVTLGNLQMRAGNAAGAAQLFDEALSRNEHFAGAWLNKAEALRSLGREADALLTLRAGRAKVPDDPGLAHSLGLALVRSGDRADALRELADAVRLAPETTRYAYVLAIMLHELGKSDDAIDLLGSTHARAPGDMNILVALFTLCRDTGRVDDAKGWASKLVQLAPHDPQVRALLGNAAP